MNHFFRSVLAILLVVLVLLSASCSSSTQNQTTTPTTPGTTAPDATPKPSVPSPEVDMLPEQEVRIVSINLLGDNKNTDARGELLADLINPLAPDSIGVQECRSAWENAMEHEFGDRYARVGLDCNGKHNGSS